MSDQPKMSERMFNLVTDYGADCINHGINTNRPLVGCPLVTGIGHQAKEASLFSAIAELEQRAGEIDFFASIVREHYADIVMPTVEDRDAAKTSDWINCAIMELGNQHKRAEKWKEAAVALYEFSNASVIQITSKAEDDDEELEYKVTLAWKRCLDATVSLGDEWDEAVKGGE